MTDCQIQKFRILQKLDLYTFNSVVSNKVSTFPSEQQYYFATLKNKMCFHKT